MFEIFEVASCLKQSHWSFRHSGPREEQRDLRCHCGIGHVPACHHAFSVWHSEMAMATGSGGVVGVDADALYSDQKEQAACEQLGESLHLLK